VSSQETPRRPKGLPVRFYPNKQIYLSYFVMEYHYCFPDNRAALLIVVSLCEVVTKFCEEELLFRATWYQVTFWQESTWYQSNKPGYLTSPPLTLRFKYAHEDPQVNRSALMEFDFVSRLGVYVDRNQSPATSHEDLPTTDTIWWFWRLLNLRLNLQVSGLLCKLYQNPYLGLFVEVDHM